MNKTHAIDCDMGDDCYCGVTEEGADVTRWENINALLDENERLREVLKQITNVPGNRGDYAIAIATAALATPTEGADDG